MKSMQTRVEELTNTVNTLEERIRTLESKLGVSGASSTPSSTPPTTTPSFSPTTNP
jgi:hypothetical protein